jgi:dTDP-4-dehydrorhamnose reductase
VVSCPFRASDRIWVLGERGQVGSAIVAALAGRSSQVPAAPLDLSVSERLGEQLEACEQAWGAPAAVINAAAYTKVDQAENDALTAFAVNALAPGELARWCASRAVPFVHYSTDYVYPGTGTAPWLETDATGPLNVYGRTKLEGDRLVEQSGAPYLLFRTSWVYNATGRNFFNAILQLGRTRERLRVVADQVGAPSYAPHIAELTLAALDQALQRSVFPSGTYHLSDDGETTWYGFAEAIVATARARGAGVRTRTIEPIPTSEYPTPAPRPLNSRLCKRKLTREFDVALQPWQRGLEACVGAWMEGSQ